MPIPSCEELCPFYIVCVEKNTGYLTKVCKEKVERIRLLFDHLPDSEIERLQKSENFRYDIAEVLVRDLLGLVE